MASNAEKQHFMYVLTCADGTLYTGYTTDVEARVRAHNEKRGAKYTATRTPVELLAYAEFETKHDAMSAEYHFKQLERAEKLAMLDAAKGDATAFEYALMTLIS